nr:rhoptry neck protein 4 [Babesia orientalis]
MSFCAKLGTIVWFTDEEINQASNVPALFDILKVKFGARAYDPQVIEKFNTLHRLSALARMICQGKLRIIENNVQNETKNVSIATELDSSFATRAQLKQIESSATELSLYLYDGQCPNVEDGENVELGNDPEIDKFRELAFAGLEIAEDVENNKLNNESDEPEVVPQNVNPLGEGEDNVSETSAEATTYTAQTPEQETNFMNRIEQVDAQDHSGEMLKPVKVTLKGHIVDAMNTKSKDIVTSSIVLVNDALMKSCNEEHLYKCLDGIRQKLFDRFEDVVSKDFVRGKFISILQTLMLRNEVYATRVHTEGDSMPEIEVFIPRYTTRMDNFTQWDQLYCKLESKNKRVEMDLSEATGPLRKRDDAQVVALSKGYPVDKYEQMFITEHPDLNLETPKEKKETPEASKNTESTGAETGADVTPNKEQDNVEPIAKPKKNIKPENHQDMQRILSKYELALKQIPNEIHGYQLAYKDIEDYPNLQQIWKLGLTTMKLMEPNDDLKTFLDKHTFTYDQLKELFNFAYGVIAVDQYESAKEFYDTAKIPKEAIETSLTKVKNLFLANTGTNITRLPPILKQTGHTCPIKDMIISLSTEDLIDRIHVMLGSWLESYEFEELPEGNFQLATLCSAAAVVVQQWRYMQLAQGYHEEGDAWILLMQSFSRMGQSKSEKPEIREKYKTFINSNAAKTCRKYMNEAGIIAHSPYKGITRNFNPLSLTGAIGNVLDQNMEASAEEIINSLREYFTTANKKNRIGNAMGVCLSLQVLNKMHNCLAVEHSNDYSLYKLGLFTKEVGSILDGFTSSNIHIEGKDRPQLSFIQMACDRRDTVVEETLDRLFKLMSTEGNTIIIETLDARNYTHPQVDENGMMADLPGGEDWSDTGYVPLDDVETLENFEEGTDNKDKNKKGESKPSFLELHNNNVPDFLSKEDLENKDIMRMLMNNDLHSGGVIRNGEEDRIDTIYDKIMNGYSHHGIADPADLRTIMFEFRMVPKFDDDELKTMMLPLVFLKNESEYLKQLKPQDYPFVLSRKIEDRMDKMKQHVPAEDFLHHVKSLANLENKDAVTLSLNKHTVDMNKKLNQYKQLLKIIKELPHDGFYFERADGKELPFHKIGKITAHSLEFPPAEPHTIVMQIIDPVHIVESDECSPGLTGAMLMYPSSL